MLWSLCAVVRFSMGGVWEWVGHIWRYVCSESGGWQTTNAWFLRFLFAVKVVVDKKKNAWFVWFLFAMKVVFDKPQMLGLYDFCLKWKWCLTNHKCLVCTKWQSIWELFDFYYVFFYTSATGTWNELASVDSDCSFMISAHPGLEWRCYIHITHNADWSTNTWLLAPYPTAWKELIYHTI